MPWHKSILLFSVFSSLAACAPDSPKAEANPQPALHDIDIREQNQIFRFQSFPARRFPVLREGGGFWPVVSRLKDGQVVAVLRGGDAHVGVKGRLDLVFSKDEGETWSSPVTVVDGPADDRNPALGVTPDGTLVLAYVILHGYRPDGTLAREDWFFDGIYVIRSHNEGRTWDRPTKIDRFPSAYVSPYGKIITLQDGSLLMTFWAKDRLLDLIPSQKDGGSTYAYVVRSRDGGVIWDDVSLIAPGYTEVGLLRTREHKIVAAMRSHTGGGTAIAISADNGRTWSPPQRVTSESEHPADLVQLESGRIILTYGERNPPRGIQAMVTHDGGKTWSRKEKLMLSWLSPNRDTGYPSSLVRRDGKILTLYYQVDDLEKSPQSAKCNALIWQVPSDW